ncbi:MAG: sporulation integral membrane protein YtvI, partial [Oscillospiraceae bacterium]
MSIEQKKQFIINVVYIITIVGIVWFALKYLLVIILPFIIGFIISFILHPVIVAITKKTDMRRKGVSFAVILLFYILIGTVIWLISVFAVGQIGSLIHELPDFYYNNLQPALVNLNNKFSEMFAIFSPQTASSMSGILDTILKQLSGIISGVSSGAVSRITGIVGKIPLYIITMIFSVVCSIFISIDYNHIVNIILRQLPDKWQYIVVDIKEFLTGTLVKMIRAYIIIMGFTTVEVFIGLLVLKVDYALPLAFLVAILDALPVIGAGTILVPWGIFQMLTGNLAQGIGLIIVYGIVLVMRNFIEPKVVGEQIGLHPLLTVTSMYAGLRLFGIIGFFLGPLTALLL